jgi:hypothetical protein
VWKINCTEITKKNRIYTIAKIKFPHINQLSNNTAGKQAKVLGQPAVTVLMQGAI